MQKFFHSTLDNFIGAGELPVWVVYRRKGVHPARLFHDHNYSEIAVIISGPARHILDGENVPVAAGDVLIVHPGAVHAYDETGGMEIINLIFDPSRLSLPQLDGYSLPLFGKIFPDGKNLYHSANPAARLAPDDQIDIFHPQYIRIPECRDLRDRTRSGKLRFSPARFHFGSSFTALLFSF